MRGRRARYLRPLQLFLLVNVLLFVVAPKVPMFTYSLGRYLAYSPPSPSLVAALVQRATTKGTVDRAAYTTVFDGRVELQRKTLILIFVPAIDLSELQSVAVSAALAVAFAALLLAYRGLLFFTTYYTL